METAQVSISGWMRKENVWKKPIYKTMDFYSALRQEEVLSFATDLEDIMLSEISQRQTNITWSHLYTESKSQTHNNRAEWWVPEPGGRGKEKKLIKEYKISVIRGLSSGDLVYTRTAWLLINNNGVYTSNLLRVDQVFSPHTLKDNCGSWWIC